MPCEVVDKPGNCGNPGNSSGVAVDDEEGDVHKAKVENVRGLIAQAFPVDTKKEEEIRIYHLWADYYRLNFWSDTLATFTRSHFVECCDGQVTLVHDDGREEIIL